MVHDPNVLIKMIVRTIVQKVRVDHAGVLLHDTDRDAYILTISRGPSGLKIPEGFARMDPDNPLIRFFREHADKRLFHDGAVVYGQARRFLGKKIGSDVKSMLKGALYQMEILGASVCIPSYFKDDLLGILFMGEKKNGRDFHQDELDFFSALNSDAAMAIKNAQLFKELEKELDKKHRLFIHTTVALAAAIDAKDHYTHGHTARVTELSLNIAQRLAQRNKKEFDKKFLENLHIAALLHDIGKIGIPESILNKEGPLNEQEKKVMQDHPVVGITILQPIRELEDAIMGVKYHHERWDGSGYPDGLKGAQIPLLASIISVADTFDAMITDRPYRKGLSKTQAIEEVKKVSGKQFDSRVAEALIELFNEDKI